MKSKKILAIITILLLMITSITGCSSNSDTEETSVNVIQVGGSSEAATEESSSVEVTEGEILINLWYTDANMTEYLTYAVDKYCSENPGVVVDLRITASTGYLENINTQSIKQTNAVDVYMLHNADLEQAYLAGLAMPYDPAGTEFTTSNYGDCAISAVTYNGKQIAYPMYFDSAFLVYNKDYVTDVPQTFEEILNFSNNLEYSEEGSATDHIEKTLIWPVSDYSFNYAFLSDAFIVGGSDGDDRSQVNVSNGTVVNSLEYYKSLYDYFAIDRKEVDYEYCVNSFIEGKNAFIFAKTDAIQKLNEAGVNYGTARMPDISGTISASSLSYTQTLVVNPYSMHIEEARKLVKAITYDYAGDFYGMTGFYPSCRSWDYNSDIVAGIYDNYDDATARPKLMTLGDYYIELEILLHTVWDDNGDTTELLSNFQNFVVTQIN